MQTKKQAFSINELIDYVKNKKMALRNSIETKANNLTSDYSSDQAMSPQCVEQTNNENYYHKNYNQKTPYYHHHRNNYNNRRNNYYEERI